MALPASEPIEEQILADIETALNGIRTDVATAYWHDIYYVERANAGAPSFSAYPAIALVPTGTDVDEDLAKNEHSVATHRLNFVIYVYLDGRSDVAKRMLRVMRDVRTALQEDPRRGERAIHTYVTSTRTYFSEDTTEPISLVEIDGYVAFRTPTNALETAL